MFHIETLVSLHDRDAVLCDKLIFTECTGLEKMTVLISKHLVDFVMFKW